MPTEPTIKPIPDNIMLAERHEENADKLGLSGFWKTPVGMAVSAQLLILLTLFVTWLSGKMDTKPIVIPENKPVVVNVPPTEKPVVVNVQPSEQKNPIKPPDVQPSPIVPPYAKPKKVVVYRTPETDPKEIAKLPPGVTADPMVYPVGSTYPNPLNYKEIFLPCMVLFDGSGKVLDIQPFVNAEGAGAMLKGK